MSRKELERALQLTWEQKRRFYERTKNMSLPEIFAMVEKDTRKFERAKVAQLKRNLNKKCESIVDIVRKVWDERKEKQVKRPKSTLIKTKKRRNAAVENLHV
ncbi:MAG: hypothetical protein LBC07_05755 [Elusimicrobiota bacterium]|jgi:hypothetical protein|nr:hypothetical protein [Elusimicrobiota bacterium]